MATAIKRKKASARRGAKNKRIRVAIIGVGNCASSLVQGVYYYRNAKPGDRIPGIMHVDLGGYHIRDVDFVAAIDVDRNKVGNDLADAIRTTPTASPMSREAG
jgi:myo-inositol-1-phosphate synthase